MVTKYTCFSSISGGKVDRDAGVIRGVSVITEGDAKGHGFKIDSQSVSSLFSLAKAFTNGVLVKFRHKQEGEHQNILTETAGSLTNFSVVGNKLKADFVPLESLAKQAKETIYELCEKFCDQFGFSPTANITLEETGEGKCARFTRLQSVDLTDEPAANLSLFSAMCGFCGTMGCTKDHDETELSTAYTHAEAAGDRIKKLAIEDYAGKTGKKLTKKTAMSAPTAEDFKALQDLVKELKTQLEAKTNAGPATAVQFTGADGKVITLSAGDIHAKLAAADAAAAEAVKAKESAERKIVLSTMEREGRVPFNPATKVAFTRAELEAAPIDQLKFYAANAPVVPLSAKAVYRGDTKPSIPAEVKGTERIAMALKQSLGSSGSEILATLSRGAVTA